MLALERLVPDGVHPNAEGQDSIAHFIYRAISAAPTAARPDAARPSLWPETDLRGGLLRVALPGAALGRARLFSAAGRELSAVALEGGRAASLPVSGLPAGNYFLSVEGPGGLRAVKPLSF
jgi:hypothetical protein